jgi:type III secretion system FlhB-like substrate exporter
MAEHRPFPPSPCRRGLARQAGLHAASPLLVATAAAAAAALVAISVLAGGLAHRLGAALVDASHAAASHAAASHAAASHAAASHTAASHAAASHAAASHAAASLDAAAHGGARLHPAAFVETVLQNVLEIALPLATAAALAALIAHLVQTRAVWLPRRRITGAPALEAGPLPRTRRATFDLAAAAVLGAVAFGWLWVSAPRLAALVETQRPGELLPDAAALLAQLAIALLVAWAVLGVLDALVRHAALSRVLLMTSSEKREDDRVTSVDPRWRAHRSTAAQALRPAEAVAGASLLLLGDDAAIAIAWDPQHRPIPIRTATGRGARATQLLGLARRHRLPIHRDAALAAALVGNDGPIAERHWPRLAEIVAATRHRQRAR